MWKYSTKCLKSSSIIFSLTSSSHGNRHNNSNPVFKNFDLFIDKMFFYCHFWITSFSVYTKVHATGLHETDFSRPGPVRSKEKDFCLGPARKRNWNFGLSPARKKNWNFSPSPARPGLKPNTKFWLGSGPTNFSFFSISARTAWF